MRDKIKFPLPSNKINITVYYKPGCPYSEAVIKLVPKLGKKDNKTNEMVPCTYAIYDAVALGLYRNKTLWENEMDKIGASKDVKDYSTYPRIFLGKKFIGGYDKIKHLEK